MLPSGEQQQVGLLSATAMEFRRSMGSRSREGKVSVFAGQGEVRRGERTEMRGRDGGTRADIYSRHCDETRDKIQFHLRHHHQS